MNNGLRLIETFLRHQMKCLDLLFHSRNANYATEAAFQIAKPFRLHHLSEGPALNVTLNKEDALKFYNQMQMIRKLEATSNVLYKAKIIRGFCHLYSGQEAIAIGIFSQMGPNDLAITSYRAHGWTYLFSNNVDEVLCELTGKVTGCCRGKGGSMHMYVPRFYGGNAIVGAQVPLGTGLALSLKLRKSDGCVFICYGDGAANNGQVSEVFNISKLWNLPCIFVCENNLFGMGTSAARSSANTEYHKRGDLIPGIWVDGMDVLSMREVTRFALDFCKSGKGPIIIEADCYRYSGHSLSDPGTSYRTRDEIHQVRESRDPIKTFKNKLLEAKLVTEEELTQIDKEVKIKIDNSSKKAQEDKEISLSELTVDIYANNVVKEVRNVNPWTPLSHKATGNVETDSIS